VGNEAYLFILLFIFIFTKLYINLGKYIKLNFLIIDQKLSAFPQNWNSINAKKHKRYFFPVGGSIYIFFAIFPPYIKIKSHIFKRNFKMSQKQ
jgi:hypothetical protein